MRKYILLFLFISCYTVGYSQVVRGIVLDEKTKTPISFASVYFNGTFAGTISDVNGCFELNRSEHTSMPLTLSAIGYYSFNLTDFSSSKPIPIYLKPKEYELKGTVVKSKSLLKVRMRNLKLFKEEFIGLSDNAPKCKILNDNDITFNYYADKDTLKAFALKPILIENKALGYTVTYYLDKFEYYRKKRAVFFKGNIVFKADEATADKQKVYAENRRETYLGSRMHFFRTLSLNDLIIKGFTITDSTFKVLKLKDIVVLDPKDNRYLNYPAGFKISYSKGTSYVNFLKNYVFFDKTGYFDASGINWIGDMGEQRIAEWLPYEYTNE